MLFAALSVASFLIASAVTPPVDTAAAAIHAAVARQNGHMLTSSFARWVSLRLRLSSFRRFARPLQHRCPSLAYTAAVIILNKSKRAVAESDDRSAVHFLQSVLHIGNEGVRGKKRAAEFKQRGTLDGLHMGPEMAVVVPQVATPASAGPRLNHHRHGYSIAPLIAWADLFEQRVKGHLERGFDDDLLVNGQRQIF